jgi:hypothetical protein
VKDCALALPLCLSVNSHEDAGALCATWCSAVIDDRPERGGAELAALPCPFSCCAALRGRACADTWLWCVCVFR